MSTGICFGLTGKFPIKKSEFDDYLEFINIVIKQCTGPHCETNPTKIQNFKKDMVFYVQLFQEKMDFTTHINFSNPIPTRTNYLELSYFSIPDDNYFNFHQVHIRKNYYELFHSYFASFGFPTSEGHFFDIEDQTSKS